MALEVSIDSTVAAIDLSGARAPADVVSGLRIDMTAHPKMSEQAGRYAHRDVLYALGEQLAPQQLQTYLPFVRRTFGDVGVGWVVYSYVQDHPQHKADVLAQVVAPMYGTGGVPEKVGRHCV